MKPDGRRFDDMGYNDVFFIVEAEILEYIEKFSSEWSHAPTLYDLKTNLDIPGGFIWTALRGLMSDGTVRRSTKGRRTFYSIAATATPTPLESVAR